MFIYYFSRPKNVRPEHANSRGNLGIKFVQHNKYIDNPMKSKKLSQNNVVKRSIYTILNNSV